MTIRHIVMWKLASADAGERAHHAANIKAGLESLPAVISEIGALEVGVNTEEDGEFDVVLVSDFASADALRVYVDHPEHKKVSTYIRSVVGGRAAVDFEV